MLVKAMKLKRQILKTLLAAVVLTSFLPVRAEDAPTVKRILFFSKSSGFEHSTIKRGPNGEPSYVEKVLQQIGASNHFEFTFSKDGSIFTPENIARFDAFFFHTTGDLTTAGTDKNPPMSQEGKRAFLQAIKDGKGFIGTHCASDTFHSAGYDPSKDNYNSNGDNTDPYVKMLGGEFIIHGAQQPTHLIVVDPKFPGMSAVPADFGPLEEWYALKNFAPDLHVLLIEDTKGMQGRMYQRAPYPSTWAHLFGRGHVFYTNMGHREDVWDNPVFQAVLIGGINWAVHNVDADVSPNLNEATPKANETLAAP